MPKDIQSMVIILFQLQLLMKKKTFKIIVSAKDTTGLKYTWTDETGDTAIELDETSATFTTSKLVERKTYKCTVEDKYGNTASTCVWIYLLIMNLVHIQRITLTPCM